MQGVEILNTIYAYDGLIQSYWIAIFIVLTLVVCILGACTTKYDGVQSILMFLATVFGISIIISFVLALIPTDKVVGTEYQVTVSDEVTVNEFYKHYEVVKQEDKIFTVRERTE